MSPRLRKTENQKREKIAIHSLFFYLPARCSHVFFFAAEQKTDNNSNCNDDDDDLSDDGE